LPAAPRWFYGAYLKKEGRLGVLQRYECADASAEDDFDSGAGALSAASAQRGVRQVGAPAFVVIKTGLL
jgi:hypothetical protein